MRLTCWYCHKPVSTELSKDAIFRAIAVCPECIEASPEADNLLIDAPEPANPADGENEPTCPECGRQGNDRIEECFLFVKE